MVTKKPTFTLRSNDAHLCLYPYRATPHLTSSPQFVDARWAEVKFLDEIQTKVLRVFLLAIQNHLHSFALRFHFLQTHAISYSFYSALQYTVKEKGGKPDRKPYPLPYGLRNPFRNLKSENSRLCPEIQRNCTFMNSAAG
jgi:hypothetical protein